MEIELGADIQVAEDLDETAPFFSHVAINDIETWYQVALSHLNHSNTAECTVRLVTPQESQSLNSQYRQKDKPTNVLSFPSELPEFVESSYIGDIVICVDIVISEANAQNKTIKAHFMHLCIHGLLHLLGYDHIEDLEAEKMESLEIEILHKLGIDDPYKVQ